MAAHVYPEPTTVTGAVGSVNDKGIKLEPHGEWFNWSKWATAPVTPERGQQVVLSLDKAGFIRHCELVDGSAQISPSVARTSDKERTITRLAVLKAAAEFGASRADLKSGDVLTIARSWEAWVTREEE